MEGKDVSNSDHPSIVHFSINKSATQYVKSVLKRLSEEAGMTPVGLHDYAFQSDFPFLNLLNEEEVLKYTHLFRTHGYLYSVFGGLIKGVDWARDYKVILAVRDPRDILVSSFYSVAKTHKAPPIESGKREFFDECRESARTMGIDRYVLSESERTAEKFEEYGEFLTKGGGGILVLKYEEMVLQYDAWLDRIVRHCEFEPSAGLIESLREENARLKPKVEDDSKHIRKGLPGDYLEKLRPETIAQLNDQFAKILLQYGYQ